VAETAGEDRLGRTLARVTCAGVDANAEQVRRGWAWVFIRYAPKDSPLYRLEAEARADKRGLWADDEPVPPWGWRRGTGKLRRIGRQKLGAIPQDMLAGDT